MIEQKYLDLAPIVRVNYTSARIDHVFRSQAGPRRYTSICHTFPISTRVPNGYLQAKVSGQGVMSDGGGKGKCRRVANIQVPAGTAMLISVSTNAFPLPGTTVSFAA